MRDWAIREHAKISPECAGPIREMSPEVRENRVKVIVGCVVCELGSYFVLTRNQADDAGII